VRVNFESILLLDGLVYPYKVVDLYITDALALLAQEVIVMGHTPIIPFQAIRQRTPADYTTTGKLTQIAVYCSFAYGGVFLMYLCIYFLNSWVSA